MTNGDLNDEINTAVSDSGSLAVCGDSRESAESNPVSGKLFELLDKRTQGQVIVATYAVSVLLGCTLAVLAFVFEYTAQTHKLAFEMRDWMVYIVVTLLSLPMVGALWSKKK